MLSRKQNCFASSWCTPYPHAEYSIDKDAVYCFVCQLFDGGSGRECAGLVWTKIGVRHWSKMKSRGKTGKPGKSDGHFHRKDTKQLLLTSYIFQRIPDTSMFLTKLKQHADYRKREAWNIIGKLFSFFSILLVPLV
jgi:hypothetical protein